MPVERISLLTNAVHWGYGTALGGVYGLVEGSLRPQPVVHGPVFGLGVWAWSYATLVPLGLYAGWGPRDVLAGKRPIIYVNAERHPPGTPGFHHTLIREAAHAAMQYAVDTNRNGTREIIDQMNRTLQAQLSAAGMLQRIRPDLHYGLTNANEFVAEAFSNPDFQLLLASVPVPSFKSPPSTWYVPRTSQASRKPYFVRGVPTIA